MLLQNIRGFVIVPIQVKPEAPKSWLPLSSLLQLYVMSFYKFVTYYIIDRNYNIYTWNTIKQVAGYIIFLKRKRRAKLKAKGCAEGRYHRTFNHEIESSSILVQSNTHEGWCVLDTTDYNYKLRSVIGWENDSKVTKWTWFNKQVRDTFYVHGWHHGSWLITPILE